MFGGIGFGELLLVAAIALIVMGPEKFPQFAKVALRAMRDLQGYVNDSKREVNQELNPLKDQIRELAQYKPEDYIDSLTQTIENDTANKEDAPSASMVNSDSFAASPSTEPSADPTPTPDVTPLADLPQQPSEATAIPETTSSPETETGTPPRLDG